MPHDLDLTPAFLFPRELPGVDDSSLVDGVREFSTTLEAVLVGCRANVDGIASDPRLTTQGKAEKIKELPSRAAGVLIDSHGEKIRRLRDAIVRGESILAPASRQRIPANVDADDFRAAEREARARLAGMDELQRRTIYLEACRTGDTQTIRSFELSPTAFPLVDEATIAAGAELFAQHAHPDEWSVLVQQRMVLANYDANLNRAMRALGDMGGTYVGHDPIADQAAAQPEPAGAAA